MAECKKCKGTGKIVTGLKVCPWCKGFRDK